MQWRIKVDILEKNVRNGLAKEGDVAQPWSNRLHLFLIQEQALIMQKLKMFIQKLSRELVEVTE